MPGRKSKKTEPAIRSSTGPGGPSDIQQEQRPTAQYQTDIQGTSQLDDSQRDGTDARGMSFERPDGTEEKVRQTAAEKFKNEDDFQDAEFKKETVTQDLLDRFADADGEDEDATIKGKSLGNSFNS